jgi:hypothetical protein
VAITGGPHAGTLGGMELSQVFLATVDTDGAWQILAAGLAVKARLCCGWTMRCLSPVTLRVSVGVADGDS